MAPKLFNMMFSTFHDCDASFRFACKRLNLRWLQDKTKVKIGVLDKLLYADDRSKNAKADRNLQGAMKSFISL